jgi:hypothetical protein
MPYQQNLYRSTDNRFNLKILNFKFIGIKGLQDEIFLNYRYQRSNDLKSVILQFDMGFEIFKANFFNILS